MCGQLKADLLRGGCNQEGNAGEESQNPKGGEAEMTEGSAGLDWF